MHLQSGDCKFCLCMRGEMRECEVMQVYENQCSTTKDQQCTTVYDTTYEDKCQTEYVR